MQPAIQDKADRDRLRQRSAGNRAKVIRIEQIVKDYAQGRAASACMVDIKNILKGAGKC